MRSNSEADEARNRNVHHGEHGVHGEERTQWPLRFLRVLSGLRGEIRQAPMSRTTHLVGIIDPDEPAMLQRVRREARVSGLLRRTELAYVGWIKRFLVEHSASSAGLSDDSGAALPAESAIRTFLTALAVEGHVAPSTQNQAKSALLFLYQKVFRQRIGFLDVVPAGKAERLPVVLSREEISQLVPLFTDLKQLMFLVMYCAGLRHRPSPRPSPPGWAREYIVGCE